MSLSELNVETYLFGLASPSIREVGKGLSPPALQRSLCHEQEDISCKTPLRIQVMNELPLFFCILSPLSLLLMVLSGKNTIASLTLLGLGCISLLLWLGLNRT